MKWKATAFKFPQNCRPIFKTHQIRKVRPWGPVSARTHNDISIGNQRNGYGVEQRFDFCGFVLIWIMELRPRPSHKLGIRFRLKGDTISMPKQYIGSMGEIWKTQKSPRDILQREFP